MGEGDGGFESLFMGESRWYSAEFLYTDNQRLPDTAFEVQGGVILQRKPISALSDEESAKLVHYSGCAITPGFVNSHNHSFQSLLKGICDDADFFTWRDDGLYKYARLMTADDLYAGAMFAFAEMLKCGITTVCDFFYINDQANDNAKAIIAAARDLGIRLTMARTLYDWDGAPDRFIESVDVAVANTKALMDDYANDPLVHVVPAPHSLHGASEALIKAGCELSAAYHRPFHMHIAEGQYERQMMLDKHGLTPIQYLDKLGVLTDRLVGIHCVWLDDTDIDRMAGAGTKLSYNPSSNMALGDGVTKIRQMLDAGITISLGTDGAAATTAPRLSRKCACATCFRRWCCATPPSRRPKRRF
ncbi:MAG: amidohydrolase family protein [Vampirovibrionales bacterium]